MRIYPDLRLHPLVMCELSEITNEGLKFLKLIIVESTSLNDGARSSSDFSDILSIVCNTQCALLDRITKCTKRNMTDACLTSLLEILLC